MRGILNNYNNIPRECWEDTNDEIVDGKPHITWKYSEHLAFTPSWQIIDPKENEHVL